MEHLLKAHEVTTVRTLSGVARKFIGRYIVIASTAHIAETLVPLRDGEEILCAKELQDYTVIVERQQ